MEAEEGVEEEILRWKKRVGMFAKIKLYSEQNVKYGRVKDVTPSGTIILTDLNNPEIEKDIKIRDVKDSQVEPYKKKDEKRDSQ